MGKTLSSDYVQAMLYSILTDKQRAIYERDMELDFAIQFEEDMRFRVNAFTTHLGPSIVFRTIPTKVLTLDDLALPDIFKSICNLTKGLVLVTGPTGSGKSTTLAAMINEINQHQKKHILTIEDPIEFIHEPRNSIINQRELHTSTKSFANALKSSLREDPDIILVGEMRDLETISLALTAAETGHLVFGTLHTTSAAKTVDRVIDVFPAADKELIRSMLSSSVQAVISQTLLKTVDGQGRVGAFDIMLGTPAIRNLIRENKIPQISSMIQVGHKHGMVSMQDYVDNLIDEGKISSDEARKAMNIANNKSEFDDSKSSANKQPSEKPKKKSVFERGGSSDGFASNVNKEYNQSDF